MSIHTDKYQKPEVTELLLKYGFGEGSDINCVLGIMSTIGNTEVARILLEKGGANVHASDNFALITACENGHTEVVRLLLDKEANVHSRNNFALILASRNGHIGAVGLLLDKGANVHVYDNCALLSASEYGHKEVVRLLLDKGADVHARNDFALILASQNGHIEIVKLFLSKGYHDSSMDKIITKNFYQWMQEFPIPSGFKRTIVMEEVERRYLVNENWIKGNREPSSNFSDITILVI